MKVLITGTAGFIGYHLALKLIERGDEVTGLDSINDYYDVNLKYTRLQNTVIEKDDIEYGKLVKSKKYSNYDFIQLDLENYDEINELFESKKFDKVVNLAAQAGVRHSLEHPRTYISSNIEGFLTILECSRHHNIKHLVYASSSSVYGLNKDLPFKTTSNIDHPASLYAASKKSNELMAHCYSHLFNIPTTGLRFFTVYGPWGRPDMALFIFTKNILENKPIDVYNYGNMRRDFTYIDDIVEGIIKVLDNPPEGNKNWNPEKPDPSSSVDPYKVYNIGNNSPVGLLDFIEAIEKNLGKKAEKNLMPMQAGDVSENMADVSGLIKDFGYKPSTPVEVGVKNFIDWYKKYYNID